MGRRSTRHIGGATNTLGWRSEQGSYGLSKAGKCGKRNKQSFTGLTNVLMHVLVSVGLYAYGMVEVAHLGMGREDPWELQLQA